MLWDNTTLPYKNVKEFVDAAKTANPPFKMGGTGSKREDQVLTVFMEKKTGAKFAYLPYKSGGEAATQLVGNHTRPTSTIRRRISKSGAPARCARCACSTRSASPTRPRSPSTQSWNDIPTCKEEGLDVQYLMLRAMFLPGKVTAGAAGVLCRPVQEGVADAEYKDYMEKQALKPIFLTGKDMLKFLEEDDKLNTNLMTEAGFVAK